MTDARSTERRSVERRTAERRSVDRRGTERRSSSAPPADSRRANAPLVERRRRRPTSVALPHRAFTPITYRGVTSPHIARDWLVRLAEILVSPLVLVASLFAVALIFGTGIYARHILLALVVVGLTLNGHLHLTQTIPGVARHIAASWLALSGLLYVMGWITGAIHYFDPRVLLIWWCVAPFAQFAAEALMRLSKPALTRLFVPPARAVVVGVNEQGVELARRISEHSSNLRMVGFFDDRPDDELQPPRNFPLLGKLEALPRFTNDNRINLIYISLPMVHQPRIQAMLDSLRDTTASIYFVPNIFVTDLIQGRVDSVNGLPVVAVCETPFIGLDGMFKRAGDIVFSLMLLVVLAPLLVVAALGIKLDSAGPVIFRQRRYGLDGKKIVVYKFRTMVVTEDGGEIRQASPRDARVTRFGAFLRRTSIDEIPQLFNVLQGRMSIVGPRPHAIAHNEMYRKLISGYMLRHKVRPGITGWAQVNGLRGETDTLDKMRERVSYDLDYLRNWSLRFDLYIMAKTVWVVVKGQNAY
jgi:putative colanic acid biosysnthesis UDP-glucose lipid carrier transferase